MNHGTVYHKMLETKQNRGGGFFLLIDPDRKTERHYLSLAESAEECGVDLILAGSSFMLNSNFGKAVKQIKAATTLPVVVFPGSFAQITPDADAILFTSLISGRNPNYLIDEQVRGAPLVKKLNLEPIPTGYMLIESGAMTSVQYISGTFPIPQAKTDIAAAHALAAQYLGMKLVYLEAGSGALNPVSIDMIRTVTSFVEIPVMVGGGLTSPEQCARRIEAGASFVVCGNCFEDDPKHAYLQELAASAHPREQVTV
jgi:putative glycerol-1-phosphate prenyltransferase